MSIVLDPQQQLFFNMYKYIHSYPNGEYTDPFFLKKRRSGRTEAILYLISFLITTENKLNIVYYTYSREAMDRIQNIFQENIHVIRKSKYSLLFSFNSSIIKVTIISNHDQIKLDKLENNIIFLEGIDKEMDGINKNNVILHI